MVKSNLWSTDRERLYGALYLIKQCCDLHNAGMFYSGIKYDNRLDRWYTSLMLFHNNEAALKSIIRQADSYLRGK